ncbi:MAG: hypothetical protein Ct9H90mP4_11270 [Gammaproteobacteria bacterium]|nr:MAG: hypothetical protein Ct9H90mP4_11270 [Gammaproteobacteria bacterium]
MNIPIILNRLPFKKTTTFVTCLFFVSWMHSSPMPGTLDVNGTLIPNSCITELKKGKSKAFRVKAYLLTSMYPSNA